MHDVTEGGVLGAAYEMAEAARLGIRLDAGTIPVPEETAALCAHLGLDPLRLIGSGALLIATPDPARTLAGVRAAGVPAAEIGRFVEAAEGRTVVRGGVSSALAPPEGDELWRALAAPGAGGGPGAARDPA
jgi:hydrogenase maturation factor